MAGDLIPPPSPAGRPDPHAPEAGRDGERPPPGAELFTDHPEPEAAPPAAQAGAVSAVAAPSRPSRYRTRFGFLTGALVGVALAAVAVVVLVAAGDGSDPGGAGLRWSAWHPTAGDRLVRAAEIAQHVGREYRLNDGSQLADVEAGPLAINDVPLTPVVRTAPKGGDIIPIYGTGVLYVLNGLATNGSISREQASTERFALVEREAVELSLYTFRYVKGVDHVVTMLPPAPAAKSGASGSSKAPADATAGTTVSGSASGTPVTALLFRPGDLRTQLQSPLSLTFPTVPPRPATITDQESGAIQQFTHNNVFTASVVPNQTGQGYLVLDRPQTTTDAEQLLRSTIPKPGG